MNSLNEQEFPRGYFMDTHTAVKKLIDSGMPEKQAESVVEIQARLLDRNLVTKTDFAELKIDFANLKTDFAEIRTDFASLKSETIRWVVGINFATAVLVVSILKYL